MTPRVIGSIVGPGDDPEHATLYTVGVGGIEKISFDPVQKHFEIWVGGKVTEKVPLTQICIVNFAGPNTSETP